MVLPSVSCVCVTGKTAYHVKTLLPQAIRSFRQQSYPADRRELLIIADDHHDLVRAEIAKVGRPDRMHLVMVDQRLTLGELRNLGIEVGQESGAEFIMQWDDDDWHGPARLANQMDHWFRLKKAKGWDRPVTLWRQIRYSFTTDTAYVCWFGPQLPIVGTILHRADTPARYPAKGKSEDMDFARSCAGSWDALKRAALDNDPADYVRLEHGKNTWDLKHIMREYHAPWARGQWHLGDRHREMLARVIEPYQRAMMPDRTVPRQAVSPAEVDIPAMAYKCPAPIDLRSYRGNLAVWQATTG